LFAWASIIHNSISAQWVLEGQVNDSKTKRALAFANISLENKSKGTITDIDGQFKLTLTDLPATIIISYLGYISDTLVIHSTVSKIQTALIPSEFSLKTIEFKAGLSAAEQLIRRVSARRDTLDPNKLDAYAYTSYNRMLLTAAADTLIAEVTTDALGRPDSSSFRIKNILDRQYLFLNESVVEKKYKKPGKSYEEVMASKTSGLNNPVISALTTQIQTLSFYEDVFSVLGINYINPLAPQGWSKYHYEITDTLISDGDTLILVSFEPLPNKQFQGMEGILYINKTHYALAQAVALPVTEKGSRLYIRQSYRKIDEIHWFPYQLHTDIIFASLNINDTIPLKLEARSYISEIQINPIIKNREFGAIAVEVNPKATERAEDWFETFRNKPLDNKDSNTYRIIDSLGRAIKLDRKLKWFQALSTGNIRVKWFDFPLQRFINANQYEGFRLGLGMETNENLIQWMRLGGYFAYGFKDEALKYGTHIEFRFLRRFDFKLRGMYINDVAESGTTNFGINAPFNLESTYRDLAITIVDSVKTWGGYLECSPVANLQLQLSTKHTVLNPTNEYRFIDTLKNNPVYTLTEIGFSMRYGIGEKYIAFGFDRVRLSSEKPILWLSATQGLDKFGGQFNYTRIHSMVEQEKKWKNWGNSRLAIIGGVVFGDAPYARLFNGRGSYYDFSIVTRNGFETVRPNEFMHSHYAGILLSHLFPPFFTFKKLSKPTAGILYNLGWGELQNINRHFGIPLKSMNKGFLEGGVFIENMVILSNSGFGIGFFYRHGPHATGNFGEDIYFKATLSLSMQ
jgi:hypothetical protein